MLSLDDLALKPPNESLEILKNISLKTSGIPKFVCIHKILPSVSRALQIAKNDFSIRDSRESCRQIIQVSLSLLSKLADNNKLDEASFGSKCLTVTIELWSMSDRSIRTALLQSCKNLVPFIPKEIVNKSIFDPMLAGFADSNAKYVFLPLLFC